MDFNVVSCTKKVLDIDIQNDAMIMWYDAMRCNRDFKFLFRDDVVVVFKEKKAIIPQGTDYLEYEFVDMETGEILVLNCSINMDMVNRRNNVYPEYIKRAIINFEINNL